MPRDEGLAIAVAGLAGFQLLSAWNANAPALSEVREADPTDDAMRVRLRDADILVGGTAIVVGTSVAVMTKDATALIVMLTVFGVVSLWHHNVLNSTAV